MQESVAVRNAKLDAIETAVGTAPTLYIFDGAMPADCATADAGTQLGSTALPSDWLGNAASGAKAKAGTWSISAAGASGLARYFRIKASTTTHMQGLVSQPYTNNTALALNQQIHVGTNVYKVTTAGTTAATGTGPTGTGTGITDGTATLAYLAPLDLQINNTNVISGQGIDFSSFSIAAANA